MSSNRSKTGRLAVLTLIVGLGASACATGQGAMSTPRDAQQAAVQLMNDTEKQVDLAWPATPSPSAEQCEGGVRFGYYLTTRIRTDAKRVATTFERFWKAEGLTVSPSTTNFGEKRGILYSATADKAGAASAAYQVSNTTVVVRVLSPCAAGSLDDYEE
jgi:hypothetical protein